MWGGPDLEGAERASNAKRRLRRCSYDIRSEVSRWSAIAPTCRKESGSVFVVYGQWQKGASKSSGKHEPTIDAAFARYVGQAYPDFLEIRIGSLDEAPSSIGAPERENWTKRRERWLSPIANAEQAIEDARDANIAPS